ncbi:MAG: radical SAM family heme chaperone HemW [Rikenellaceae bacterium]
MAGLYIHIPYCKSMCVYCDFHSCVALSSLEPMIEALKKEMTLRRDYIKGQDVDTIYIGGGTPSLCTAKQIEGLVNHASSLWNTKNCVEITMEANPDDLSVEYLRELRSVGINRLSIGIQSFDDKVLKFLRRRHGAKAAMDSVAMARQAGFDNISIDLIYGIPDMSIAQWQHSLDVAVGLGVEHISAYHLTVEEGTPLDTLVEQGKVNLVSEQDSQDQFEMLRSQLERAGIEQYEISNYARLGRESKHNSSYWHGIHYIGIGPGAHSYDGASRRWNLPDNQLYMDCLAQELSYQTEELTPTMQYDEYIMTALRTTRGIDYQDMENKLGAHKLQLLKKSAKPLLDDGLLESTERGCAVSRSKLMICDMIIAELFEV